MLLRDTFKIKLKDAIVAKLEDAIGKKENILINVSASHYGMLNGNSVIYRHDTVKNNIHTFVYPTPKPIIKNHRPKESDVFGRVVAAEYKNTEFYDKLNDFYNVEDLSTLEYLNLCKTTIIPYQKHNPGFNGLGFVELTGKIDHQEGIKKILDEEFLYVSIGAKPKRMICSECLQDQLVKMCDHYPNRRKNNIFMLAEELEYEELSFVKKPADPYGKISYIYDGVEVEYEVEHNIIDADIDIIYAKDFFQEAEGKTIICVDNICTIVNEDQEEIMAKQNADQKTTVVSYIEEFSVDKLKDLKIIDSEEENIEDLLTIKDEDVESLTNKDFAIVQKTSEGIKRRFPINSELSTKVAVKLIDEALDLTESERVKAKASIAKAAKKFNVEIPVIEDEENTEDNTETPSLEDALEVIKGIIEKVEFEEKEDGTIELKDSQGPNPVNEVFNMLISFAGNLKWAGEALNDRVTGFLVDCGKEACAKGVFDAAQEEIQSLKDSVTDLTEEIELLEDQNRELNYQIRVSIVDEIIDIKRTLEILDSEEDEKTSLNSMSYDSLQKQVNDYRKLRAKMQTGSVNNKTDIKIIADPTLTDEDGDASKLDTNTDSKLTIEDSKSTPSPEDLVKAFTLLFRRN